MSTTARESERDEAGAWKILESVIRRVEFDLAVEELGGWDAVLAAYDGWLSGACSCLRSTTLTDWFMQRASALRLDEDFDRRVRMAEDRVEVVNVWVGVPRSDSRVVITLRLGPEGVRGAEVGLRGPPAAGTIPFTSSGALVGDILPPRRRRRAYRETRVREAMT